MINTNRLSITYEQISTNDTKYNRETPLTHEVLKAQFFYSRVSNMTLFQSSPVEILKSMIIAWPKFLKFMY